MAKGKKISEQPIVDSLQGDELIPFAKNGGNATVTPETIKEYVLEDVTDSGDIPTKVSELENDLNFQTKSEVNDLLDGFAPKSWLASTDKEVSRINDALINGLNDKVDKIDGKGLSANDFSNTDKSKLDGIEDGAQVNPIKVSELQNDAKYQTESEVDAKIAEYAEDLQDVLDDKVDKVVGKELSTNDYTDSDKAKLTALPTNAELTATLGTKADKSTTYTKTETDTRIENLGTILSDTWDAQLVDAFNNLDNKKADKTAIPTNVSQLTNDSKYQTQSQVDERFQQLIGAAPADLDTLEELAEKLQDGDDIHTALIQSISKKASKEEVVALCAETYAKKSTSLLVRKGGGDYVDVEMPSTELSELAGGNGYLQCWDNASGWWNFKAGKFIVNGGTSSQFLKADGSVDGTAYLPTASYTASDVLDKVKSVDGSGSGLDADLLDGKQSTDFYQTGILNNKSIDDIDVSGEYRLSDTTSGTFPFDDVLGCSLLHNRYDNNAAQQILFAQKKYALYYRYKSLTTWSDWKQIAFTDSNVASADKLTTKQLTNEDLNDLRTANTSFFATTGHTVSNIPVQVNAFGLQVLPTSGNNVLQLFTTYNDGTVYKRIFTGSTWSSWQQLATTDGAVAKLTTKQLTNEDLNDIKDVNFSSYRFLSSTNLVNAPFSGFAGTLQVYGYDNILIVQVATKFAERVETYKRICLSGTWKPWKKMLTEDDIAGLVSRIEALEARTQVAGVASLPSSPNSNTLYAISE